VPVFSELFSINLNLTAAFGGIWRSDKLKSPKGISRDDRVTQQWNAHAGGFGAKLPTVPYGALDFDGTVSRQERRLHRSGHSVSSPCPLRR
jgi:hypothetical protein